MKNTRKWMLGAALAVGGLGFGASTAHAAQFGVYVGSPAAYVPPCPGPGYSWEAGYQADGYWVPGRWAFVGVSGGRDYGYARYYGDRDDHRFYRDRDRDRDHGWDRERNFRDHDDHDRRDGDHFRR